MSQHQIQEIIEAFLDSEEKLALQVYQFGFADGLAKLKTLD